LYGQGIGMAKNKIEDTFTHKFSHKFNEHEKFIEDNLLYEVIGGSFAYGVNNEDSDYDIVSIFMDKHSDLYPQNYGYILGFDTETGRMENKELKGENNRIIHKGVEVEAEWRALTRFAHLAAVKGSPNLVEILFVRSQCITYIHPSFQIIRDNASKFISMRSYHAFKGYMHSQFMRIKHNVDRGKTDNPKRQYMLDEYGYDCYASDTEFLTDSGWKLYDDISPNDKLCTASYDLDNSLTTEYQHYTNRIKKQSDILYHMKTPFSECRVSENHNMLVSNCHRGKRGYKYANDDSMWYLAPIKDLYVGSKSWYHIHNCINNGNDLDEQSLFSFDCFTSNDDILTVIGLYLSDGTMGFRDGKPKDVRIVQTSNGKPEVFNFMDSLPVQFGFKKYTYDRVVDGRCVEETVWSSHGDIVTYIFNNWGYSKNKTYPKDIVLKLSTRQSEKLRYGMFIGDGYINSYGREVYYSTSKDLADLYQLLSFQCGYESNILGPYNHPTEYSKNGVDMYQVLTHKEYTPSAVCISDKNKNSGVVVEEYNGDVVCFEVPNCTLVTRYNGKIAIQGNCKMSYHILRLMDILDQMLNGETQIDLMRNKDECKRMRNGQWGTWEDFQKYTTEKLEILDNRVKSGNVKLINYPRHDEIRNIINSCIEEWYGSSAGQIVMNRQYVSADEVFEMLNTINSNVMRLSSRDTGYGLGAG